MTLREETPFQERVDIIKLLLFISHYFTQLNYTMFKKLLIVSKTSRMEKLIKKGYYFTPFIEANYKKDWYHSFFPYF